MSWDEVREEKQSGGETTGEKSEEKKNIQDKDRMKEERGVKQKHKT